MKKKIALFLLLIMTCSCICGCNKYIDIDRDNKDAINVMLYNITRARYDNDIDKINKYVPNIFVSEEMKNSYIEDVLVIKENKINSIGIHNVVYKNIDKEKILRLKKEMSERYGVSEDNYDDIKKEGVVVFEILYYDKKGKKCTVKSENFAYMYKDKWYMLIIKEELEK